SSVRNQPLSPAHIFALMQLSLNALRTINSLRLSTARPLGARTLGMLHAPRFSPLRPLGTIASLHSRGAFCPVCAWRLKVTPWCHARPASEATTAPARSVKAAPTRTTRRAPSTARPMHLALSGGQATASKECYADCRRYYY